MYVILNIQGTDLLDNFISNLVSGLIAYSFLQKKPSIKMKNMLPNVGIA